MDHEPILLSGSDRMISKYVYHKPFMVKFSEKYEWYNGFNPVNKGELILGMDRSKTTTGTCAGMCRWGLRRIHSFSLGLHTTVFQIEKYIINACILENTEKGYTAKNIYIVFVTVLEPSRPTTDSR
jgi:hypothetical protein